MASFLRPDRFFIVQSSALHGDGVFAAEPQQVRDEEPLWEETPNLFLQSVENRADALICANCHGFVGTLGTQLDVLHKKVSREDTEQLATRAMQPQGSEDEVLSKGIVFCEQECGEMYCSPACAREHWNRSHCLLCTGSMVEDEPLVNFKMHAIKTNEIFLMVADHFAEICTRVDAAVGEVEDENQKKQYAEAAAREATQPYATFVRNLWWDVALPHEGEDPRELAESLINLVNESWNYLNIALCLEQRGLAEYLSVEYMSRTIGMFEQNNVGVRLQSPLADKVGMLEPGEEQVKTWSTAVEQIAATLPPPMECMECEDEEEEEGEGVGEREEEEEEEESGDPAYDAMFRVLEEYGDTTIFPPVDGAAFYLKICKINHSCEPNVRVEYKHGNTSAVEGERRARNLIAYVKVGPF